MSSRLKRDETLEKEDRIDEMKKKKHTQKKKKNNSPPVPHLLQAQQVPALPYAKVVGRYPEVATQHHRPTQPPTNLWRDCTDRQTV